MNSARRRRKKRAELGPGGIDRRAWCRYPAVLQVAQLQWVSAGLTREGSGVLLNVSMQGCLLRMRSGPGSEPGLAVKLRTPGVEASDDIEGVLVASRRSLLGVRTLRIRFLRSLTFGSFKSLVYGPQPDPAPCTQVPEHEMDIYWR